MSFIRVLTVHPHKNIDLSETWILNSKYSNNLSYYTINSKAYYLFHRIQIITTNQVNSMDLRLAIHHKILE